MSGTISLSLAERPPGRAWSDRVGMGQVFAADGSVLSTRYLARWAREDLAHPTPLHAIADGQVRI